MDRSRLVQMMVAGLLVASALLELVHIALGKPWPELTSGSLYVGGLLAVVWIVTAVLVATRKSSSLPSAVLGSMTLLGHGAVLRTAHAALGMAYLIAGALALAGTLYAMPSFVGSAPRTRARPASLPRHSWA